MSSTFRKCFTKLLRLMLTCPNGTDGVDRWNTSSMIDMSYTFGDATYLGGILLVFGTWIICLLTAHLFGVMD
jgi:hypothetical protein